MNWHTFFLENPLGEIFLEYGSPISFSENDNFESCKKILVEGMEKIEKNNTDYAKEKLL